MGRFSRGAAGRFAWHRIVGVPGTPTCFGQRISHGSSAHDLTPKKRAAGLQKLVAAGFPPAVEQFGETVTVQEMIKLLKVNSRMTPIASTPPGRIGWTLSD